MRTRTRRQLQVESTRMSRGSLICGVGVLVLLAWLCASALHPAAGLDARPRQPLLGGRDSLRVSAGTAAASGIEGMAVASDSILSKMFGDKLKRLRLNEFSSDSSALADVGSRTGVPLYHVRKREANLLRVFVLGDSISNGLAPQTNRRKDSLRSPWKHPNEGLCSYRSSLYRSLSEAVHRQNLQAGSSIAPFFHSIVFSGPVSTAHGGPHPHRCEALGRHHSATWGITAKEVANTKPSRTSRAHRPLHERSKLARKGTALHQWALDFRPDLLFVLLGTNDLNKYQNTTDLLVADIGPILEQTFLGAEEAWKGSHESTGTADHDTATSADDTPLGTVGRGGSNSTRNLHDRTGSCPVHVVLAELLPRNDSVNPLCSEYNRLLHAEFDRGDKWSSPRGAVGFPFLPFLAQWSSCIHVIRSPTADDFGLRSAGTDGAPSLVTDKYLYDGLHPSPLGEKLLGELYAKELLGSSRL